MRTLTSTALALSLIAGVTRARADDVMINPVGRLTVGPSIHLAPAAERGTYAAVEVTGGFAALFNVDRGGFGVNPELGYTYDASGLNAFNLTCGVGWGFSVLAVGYHPRLIVGNDKGMNAIGMRNGITAHLVADILSVEVGHQFVQYGGAYHQSLQFLFGVNPVGMFSMFRRVMRID